MIAPDSLKETILWQHLAHGYTDSDPTASVLSSNIYALCEEAANRMLNFPSLHKEYTIHENTHLLRVTMLMAIIVPADVLRNLNPVEVALLILSAYFHDQGMVPDAADMSQWEFGATKTDPKFVLFRDNWMVEHPNFKSIERQLNDPSSSTVERQRLRIVEASLFDAMLSDYLRTTHGERSASIVRQLYGNDPRLVVQGANIANVLAKLCESHVLPVSNLLESNGFRVDERIGVYAVNMVYLALVLRLADVMDFDRERTPDSLYKTIDFKSPVSMLEWAKHRSVTGWDISADAVQFTLECEHPEYERAAKRFMDYIDDELQNAVQRTRDFPARASKYYFDLPLKTDRSRISPKDDAYIYHDLEFSLSRNEVVKLLMTERLYGSASLCIRELLQNALDALRYRKALFEQNGLVWNDGEVQFLHDVDSHGYEFISCIDNGVGMSRDIILNFLTKAGRSYYRSPQFEQERIGLKAAGVDFDPCAQFGIGFMSCFMLGDHIVIQTRRDKGHGKGHDEPLVVEINGVGGIVVLRSGVDDQPIGTTVTVTGRKKPRFLDYFEDKVKLIPALLHNALATEFPISADCKIEGISESICVPPTFAKPLTPMENCGLKKIITFEQSFSIISPYLNGILRISFLVDDSGNFTLENSESFWTIVKEVRQKEPELFLKKSVDSSSPFEVRLRDSSYNEGPITLDGIMVTGTPGRTDIRTKSMEYYGYSTFSHNFRIKFGSFLLDIRGPIKPPLTPARQPAFKDHGFMGKGPQWNYIHTLLLRAQGMLWEQVAKEVDARTSPETFWQLGIIYGGYTTDFRWMRSQAMWDWLSIPIVEEDGNISWKRLSDVGFMEIIALEDDSKKNNVRNSSASYILKPLSGGRISTYDALTQWSMRSASNDDIDSITLDPTHVELDMKWTVSAASTMVLREGRPFLEFRLAEEPDSPPADNILGLWDLGGWLLTLVYAGEAAQYLSMHSPCQSVNRQHPLVRLVRESRWKEHYTDLEMFANRLVWCLSNQDAAPVLKTSHQHLKRWYREVGARFLDVDWVRVAPELQPPYKIRLADGTTVSMTAELLESWAKATPDPSEK